MANEKMNIIDALKQLRNDLKLWVANNLTNLKTEISESIVSESTEFTVVDEEGNAVAKIGEEGLVVTAVNTKSVAIDGTDVQQELDKKASLYIGSDEMPEGYDIQIDPDSEAFIVPVESGGTGATTAAAARENLGFDKEKLDSVPMPTIDDEGKFLLVKNGTYALVSLTDVSTEGA